MHRKDAPDGRRPPEHITPTTLEPSRSVSRLVRGRLGGAMLVLGAVQFLAAHLIVQSAWTSPSYSWWSNYISDLGAVGCGPLLGNDVCSPWHAAMNTAFVLQGALLLGGTALVTLGRSRGATKAVPTMLWLVGVSWVVIGLVPEDVSLTGHSVGALPVFVLGSVVLVTAGFSRLTRGRPIVRSSALVLGAVGFAGLALMAAAGPGGLVGIGLAERLVVFPLQLWTIAAGVSFVVRPSPEPGVN